VTAKLCVLILAIGTTAGTLLHLRQARLQAVHELAELQKRFNQHDRDLFTIRTQIAQAVTPERVQQMASTLGPMRPIGVDPLETDGQTVLTRSDAPAAVRPVSHSTRPDEPAGKPGASKPGAASGNKPSPAVTNKPTSKPGAAGAAQGANKPAVKRP
jgi:hypothetical protein